MDNMYEKSFLEDQTLVNSFTTGLIGVFFWKSDDYIVDANKKFLELTGYTQDDLKQKKIIWSNLSSIGEKLKNNDLYRVPYIREIIKKDGTRIFVEIMIALIDKMNLSGVAYLVDIQNKKIIERKLNEYNATLEKTKIVKEKIEPFDKLHLNFLAVASHEIRSPLNSIIGFSGILLTGKAGNLNCEQKKQIEMIKFSGMHLLNIINSILDFSSIESGKLKVNEEVFSINEVIESIIKMEEIFSQEKGVDLLFSDKTEEIIVNSDKQKVFRIILNLVNNAIKFTNHGNITLRCFKDNDYVKIIVSDTGIGIHHEQLDRIFQPFIKIEDNGSRTHKGTGLGLSICKRLIEILKGSISVQSEYGKGTTFTCTLPVSVEK